MRLIRGVYRFLYDFIIGDDWKIAAGVVIALAFGLTLLTAGLAPAAAMLLTVAGVAAAFVTALVVDVRSAAPRDPD
jgi:hypothetical protein